MLKNKQLYSLLGLASCARKIVSGETLLKSIQSNKVQLVLLANDASENTKKKYLDKCKYYSVPIYLIDDTDSLSKAIGKDNRVCVGVIDVGFASKIKSILGG
jgi:ribosomal protein L7Ae-like RNA K-turn-binding protein